MKQSQKIMILGSYILLESQVLGIKNVQKLKTIP